MHDAYPPQYDPVTGFRYDPGAVIAPPTAAPGGSDRVLDVLFYLLVLPLATLVIGATLAIPVAILSLMSRGALYEVAGHEAIFVGPLATVVAGLLVAFLLRGAPRWSSVIVLSAMVAAGLSLLLAAVATLYPYGYEPPRGSSSDGESTAPPGAPPTRGPRRRASGRSRALAPAISGYATLARGPGHRIAPRVR